MINLNDKTTSVTNTSQYSKDYKIALLLVGAKCVPYTDRNPVTIQRNKVSMAKVASSFPINLRELIGLFWRQHNVEFRIYNFETIESCKQAVYATEYEKRVISSNSAYLYYEKDIPIEYPAILSAQWNSGVISPIWDFETDKVLANADVILAIENKKK